MHMEEEAAHTNDQDQNILRPKKKDQNIQTNTAEKNDNCYLSFTQQLEVFNLLVNPIKFSHPKVFV